MSKRATIISVEWARLRGYRPRTNGCNARLGSHGKEVFPTVARITASDGASGFGWARLEETEARGFIGTPLDELFTDTPLVCRDARVLEYPLYDLAAKQAGIPVYRYVAPGTTIGSPLRVGCYDTSLYIDDLDISDNAEAAALIAEEAADGFSRGHRAFKIKVGRGAMHMDIEPGTCRDIEVIKAVRKAVGPESKIMIDANNGYTLNLAKRVLAETAECNLYWIEEPFHEDPALYQNLKDWMSNRGIKTMTSDGEGDASPRIVEWAAEGLIDILQFDIRSPGFSFWLEKGREFDRSGIKSAPHFYGGYLGNFVAGHLSGAIAGLEMTEWDETSVDGLDAPGYKISDGLLSIPDSPGFGIDLDNQVFTKAVRDEGFRVEE